MTPELVTTGAHLAYAHLDADFPLTAYNDATTPARGSDHDVAVGYFTVPVPVLLAAVTPTTATLPSTTVGATSAGQVFTLTNTGEAAVTVGAITVTGPYAVTNSCGASLAFGATCNINVVFKPTAAGTATGTLQVITSASTTALSSNLTGLGLVAPDFTIGDSTGKSTTSVTVAAGNPAIIPLTVTPNATFSRTKFSFSCVVSGAATPSGVICTAPGTSTVSGAAVTFNWWCSRRRRTGVRQWPGTDSGRLAVANFAGAGAGGSVDDAGVTEPAAKSPIDHARGGSAAAVDAGSLPAGHWLLERDQSSWHAGWELYLHGDSDQWFDGSHGDGDAGRSVGTGGVPPRCCRAGNPDLAIMF